MATPPCKEVEGAREMRSSRDETRGKRPQAKLATRRSSRQPGALPSEIRLSEQRRRSSRSCECVNVWRELGSSETEMQEEKRTDPEDRAGVKRANWESNREDRGSCHCCPS